jgi:hypothetical protein
MLRDSQRRRLSVRFGRLLEEAEELERAVQGKQAARDMLIELSHLIELVHRMAKRFDLALARRDRDALDQLEFWSAVWWTRVLDCRSSALTAVGPVDPELGESLDEAVDEIATQLLRIRDLSLDRSSD